MKGLKTIFLFLVLLSGVGEAQPPTGAESVLGVGSETQFTPDFEVEYVRPEIHKWFGPRNLYETYMQPWYSIDTGYSTDTYLRYVDRLLEGSEWYDSFGTPLGRGWLVYSWMQSQPEARGSEILKRPANAERRDTYSGFFDRLVIASDGDGHGTYRLMIGDEIYTSFTPMTFYKPRFDGMRLDYATDRYSASLILSRPSSPDGGTFTDATHVMGGHSQFQLADFARFGLTYVNAHNVQTKADFTRGNPLRGVLTSHQNQALERLWVRIRDDSPADGIGGASVFDYDIVLTDTSGRELRGSEIDFLPFVEGGLLQNNTLIADGSEEIILEYDLDQLDYEGIGSVDLRRVGVELSVADDYRIEMASDLQTGGQDRRQPPVFLLFDRAAGNVQDRSNGTVLRLDYVLPTANELIGFDWDLAAWHGLSLKGEMAVNRRYGQYPSPNISQGHEEVSRAVAAYGTVLYRRYPWTFYGEFFSVGDAYSTSYWLPSSTGQINYQGLVPQLYEFVDDDDDLNALPDWERPFQRWSAAAWPGYDENGDFIHDYNQNGNLIPDYEEPFLRYRSDRPEFLFGVDMNHNGTIDRFENDDHPDYPYRRDHRGGNAYVRAHFGPNASLTLGRQQMELIDGDGRTEATYFVMAWNHSLVGGRLRFFDFGGLIEDDIPDDLNLWVQPLGAVGRMRQLRDPLPERNTWKNSLYVDLDHRLWSGIRMLHRFKREDLHQRDPASVVRGWDGRRRAGFTGVINKAEWSLPVGLAVLEPRWKSAYSRRRPYDARLSPSTVLEETFFLIWTQPLMAESVGVSYFPKYGRQLFATDLQVGLETSWLKLLDGGREEVEEDYRSWTVVGQLTNRVGYLGYQLITRAGLRLGKRTYASGRSQRTSIFFMTINAGL